MGLGVCYILRHQDARATSLAIMLFGIATNLLVLLAAVTGVALTQSLVLTAVVISTGTIALWILNTHD
jgi:multisubunit Na+/H+ antiporter MnhC subunit